MKSNLLGHCLLDSLWHHRAASGVRDAGAEAETRKYKIDKFELQSVPRLGLASGVVNVGGRHAASGCS